MKDGVYLSNTDIEQIKRGSDRWVNTKIAERVHKLLGQQPVE